MWKRATDGVVVQLRLASPIGDASGNAFLIYNPGRYNGVTVLRPDPRGGIATLNTFWGDYEGQARFYNSRLLPLNRDGLYVIRHSEHGCDPSCAKGSTTSIDYQWNGMDYAPAG